MADDPPPPGAYQPQIVPKCKPFEAKDGTWVCGYANVDDWKLVLSADSELVAAREQLRIERERNVDLTQQRDALQGQVDVLASTRKLLEERNDKLTKELIALDRKYQNERVKGGESRVLPWTIAIVTGAALAGFVIADQL